MSQDIQSLTIGHLAAHYHPCKNPKARVLLIHGLSEHSGRHLNTVNYLTSKGYEVVRFDLRGAGRSGGRRQWIKTFDDYVQDASSAFNWINRELPNLPLFVLGHSLGGAIAVHFAATYQNLLHGLLLSAPAYIVGNAISPVKIAVGRMLVKMVPTLRMPNASDLSAVSRDPEAVKAYAEDELSCRFNTIQQGDEILKALDRMPELAKKLELPVVFFHGTSDRIIRLSGSFELMQKCPSKDKTFHILPGGFHEPHNDLDKLEYFQLVDHWLGHRLSRPQ